MQLEQQLASYRHISHQLARVREQLRQAAASSATKTQRLLEMTDQLEMVKMEMENRGSWMLDGQNEMLAKKFIIILGSPLVNIRRSLARIKKETTRMDVRIGILEHRLIQNALKGKHSAQTELQDELFDV